MEIFDDAGFNPLDYINNAQMTSQSMRDIQEIIDKKQKKESSLPFKRMFQSSCERPNAKMSILCHKRIGECLKKILLVIESESSKRKRVKKCVEKIRWTLDDWVQLEYTPKELSHKDFPLLYADHSDIMMPGSAFTNKDLYIVMQIIKVQKILVENYPISCPLQILLKKILFIIKNCR